MTRVRLPFESAIAGSGSCCWKDCLDRKMNILFAESRTFSSFLFSRQRMISHSVHSCILALWFTECFSIYFTKAWFKTHLTLVFYLLLTLVVSHQLLESWRQLCQKMSNFSKKRKNACRNAWASSFLSSLLSQAKMI